MRWGYPGRQRLTLFAGDCVVVSLATLLGTLLRLGEPINVFRVYTGASLVFITSYLAIAYVLDVYDADSVADREVRLVRLLAVCTISALISSAAFYFLPYYRYGRGIFVLSAGITLLLAYGWRSLYQRFARQLVAPVPTIVVGTGRGAEKIRQMITRQQAEYDLVGFVRTSEAAQEDGVPPELVLGNVSDLEALVRKKTVRCLVMVSRMVTQEEAGALTRMKFEGVVIYDVLDFCMRAGEEIPIEFLDESWLWFTEGFQEPQTRLVRRIKRLWDLALATTGLLITLPVSLLLAALIKLESPGPVFIVQERMGLQERTFGMIKFRSMYIGAEADNPKWTRVGDKRITRLGRVMRMLHLDEIPQMVNVLKGEMSIIGPRPERPGFVEELKKHIPFYHLRHYVRPGITGWAQVNFPYTSSIEEAREKVQYDLYYVVKSSFLLDVRIVLRTLRVIIHRRGSR